MKNIIYLIIIFILIAFAVIIPSVLSSSHEGSNGTLVWGTMSLKGILNSTNYTYPITIGSSAPTGTGLFTTLQPINWTKIVSSTQRDEFVAAQLKGDGSLYILNCSNNCQHPYDWRYIGNLTVAATVVNASKRGFDLATFDNGDIMVVFANGTNSDKVFYCVWNGSAWGPNAIACPNANTGNFIPGVANEINVTSVGTPLWVTVKALGNKALLGVAGVNGFSVVYWNGSWVRNMTISTTRLSQTNQSEFDLAFENQSAPGSTNSDGLVVFDLTTADGTTFYRRFNGTNDTWDPADKTGPDTGSGDNRWIELASDPSSRRISMIIADSEDDAHLYIWKMNNFTEGFTTTTTDPIDGTIETTTGKVVTTTWSYNRSTALFAYVDSNGLALDAVCWNPQNNFSAVNLIAVGNSTDDIDRIQAVRSPRNNDSIIISGDIVADMIMYRWNGSRSCLDNDFKRIPNAGIIEPFLSVALIDNPQIPFSFDYKRFVASTVGAPAATQLPISFDNATNESVISHNEFINFSTRWLAGTNALDEAVFSIDNGTGTFVNDTPISLASSPSNISIVRQVPAVSGTTVQWRFFANDTAGNWNATNVQSFTVSLIAEPSGLGCGYVNSNLEISKNIQTIGTCFIINASSVMLSGKSFNISGNQIGYAVNLTKFNDVVIKEFEINNFSIGIYVNNSYNSTIYSNLIESTILNQGILADYQNFQLNITNNKIFKTSGDAIILSTKSNNSILKNNSISITANSMTGISIVNSLYLNITNNNITTAGATSYAIKLSENAKYINISNNSLITFGSSSNGINLKDTIDNIIEKNKINTNNLFAFSIALHSGSINNNFSFNVMNAAAGTYNIYSNGTSNAQFFNNNLSVYIFSSTSNFTLRNTTLINQTVELFFENLTIYYADIIDTTINITLFNNTARLNESQLTRFNTTTNITFSGVSYTSSSIYRILRNRIKCPSTICTKIGFNPVRFQVTSFGNYNTTINSAPSNVTLLSPDNATTTLTNRTVTFVWSNATDADDDDLTYNLLVDDNQDFTSTNINITIPGNSAPNITYFSTTELSTDTKYFWKVAANDTNSNGSYSAIKEFTIASTVALSLNTSQVDFGSPGLGDIINTTLNNPSPIVIQNDGNVLSDLNLSLIDDLWVMKSAPSSFFRYKADNATGTTQETGSFNYTGSITTFTNIPLTNESFVKKLNYTDSNDTAELDLEITIPTDEPAGNKSAILIITGWVSA